MTFYDVPPEGRFPRIVKLVSAAWERGKRLLVICGDAAEAAELDQLLWTYDEAAFIPHEVVANGQAPKDPDARIVLMTEERDPIGAEILLQASPASRGFAQRYPFVIDLVDHRSQEALDASRARYKAWAADGFRPGFVKR